MKLAFDLALVLFTFLVFKTDDWQFNAAVWATFTLVAMYMTLRDIRDALREGKR